MPNNICNIFFQKWLLKAAFSSPYQKTKFLSKNETKGPGPTVIKDLAMNRDMTRYLLPSMQI